jgi:hypothetical protein
LLASVCENSPKNILTLAMAAWFDFQILSERAFSTNTIGAGLMNISPSIHQVDKGNGAKYSKEFVKYVVRAIFSNFVNAICTDQDK